PRDSRIWASTKWPIRHLAMTGMVTVFWISWIFLTGDMRATPPSRRMSAGTRSRAMTATAPASSAILACSALVTSMMTPPLSISASPTLSLSVPTSMMFVLSCCVLVVIGEAALEVGPNIGPLAVQDRETGRVADAAVGGRPLGAHNAVEAGPEPQDRRAR